MTEFPEGNRYLEGWNGAPRLGLEPKKDKVKYGNELWDARPSKKSDWARWQAADNADWVFTIHVRLALEYLQHFRQIPEWEEAVSISMGHGCYRKRPGNAVFGG